MFGRRIGRRVGPRHVRGNRAIIDDAPAARRLGLHDLDGFLRAQKCAGEIDAHHSVPLLVAEIFHGYGGRAHARVVEEHVQAPERFLGPGEQRSHRFGIADVGRHREHLAGACLRHARGAFKLRSSAPGEHYGISGALQCKAHRAADAAARAGH